MNTRLLILGSTGMLGNTVAKYFLKNYLNYDVTVTYKDIKYAFCNKAIKYNVLVDDFDCLGDNYDYVINCIGIIKPFMKKNLPDSIYINSIYPWKLAEWCNSKKMRLIHITTDCVYSGIKGKYVESDIHDAWDEYGKSKSLGECYEQSMVLRTSIIGEEIHQNASLIAWSKKQKGKTIDGYVDHMWNGVTTLEYAKICEKIICNNWFEYGLFHIHAKDDVSKYDMMVYFNEKYNLGMNIHATSPHFIDRTLRSTKLLCSKLEIPTVKQMIEAL